MKHVFRYVVVSIIMLSMISIGAAEESYFDIEKNGISYDSVQKTMDQVLKTKKNVTEDDFTLAQYDIESALFCTRIYPSLLIGMYKEGISLSDMNSQSDIPDPDRVLVSGKTNEGKDTLIELQVKNGSLQYFGQSTSASSSKSNIYVDLKKINETVASIEGEKQVEAYFNERYGLYLFQINAGEKTYIAPVVVYPLDEEGIKGEYAGGEIKSYEIYEIDTFFEKMDKIFDENIWIEHADEDGLGLPYRKYGEYYKYTGSENNVSMVQTNKQTKETSRYLLIGGGILALFVLGSLAFIGFNKYSAAKK